MPQLYAFHLSQCPSFSITNNSTTGTLTEGSLPILKTRFIQEIKRNLFAAYLQPRRTTISLISTTTSSSAAFPGGEAFDFTFSPKGQWCLALSSSRIIILNTAAHTVAVSRELKVPRRPLSAAILDSGAKLAVLSTDHQINLYDLTAHPVKYLRSVSLNNSPDIITMSSKGEVLAAAYDGGVEVHSLAEHALPTDSRVVKCDRVDSLAFSCDGTMLLGTTQAAKDPNTVILSAPYFTDTDHDLPHAEIISHMWTSQILFPNSSRDCSHAALLPHRTEGDASWALTYDRVFDSFRAVRTDDLRNGTTYFTGPKPTKSRHRKSKSRLVPCTLPTITQKGDLVAAGFLGSEIWLYGVPDGLDIPVVPNVDELGQSGTTAGPSALPNAESSPLASATQHESPELENLPRWQVLVDKYRNVFAKGRCVAKVSGVANMCWVGRRYDKMTPYNISERLIIAAPGGVCGSPELDQEELASVDGGRLVVLDFDRTTREGSCENITVEVGNVEPELLEEKNLDMATEIAIVRRRTIVQRNQVLNRNSVADALRPVPSEGDIPDVPPIPLAVSVGFGLDSSTEEAPMANEPISREGSPTEGPTLAEVSDALDGPYSHTQPRPRNTLYRSATAVAASRQRAPPRLPLSGRVEYRRTDGTELPHESDADNWVPPPPPYTPDADRPLPEHFRNTLIPHLPVSHESSGAVRRPPLRSQTAHDIPTSSSDTRRRNSGDFDQLIHILRRPEARRQQSDYSVSPARQEHDIQGLIRQNVISSEIPTIEHSNRHMPAHRPTSAYVYNHQMPDTRPQTTSQLSPSTLVDSGLNSRGRSISNQSRSLPTSPINSAFSNPHLTISGSNLQQRLDYPLPPPPSPGISPTVSSEPSPSPPLHRNEVSPLALPPPSPELPQTVDLPSMPSAYQLNNLQNRYNNPLSSQLDSHSQSSIAFGQGTPVPAPPRAALGAAGSRPISRSSFYQAPIVIEAPARSLSRNNSRGSARSGTTHAYAISTPNLPRPQAQRLDTIASVASIITRGRSREAGRPMSRMRTRTMSEGPVEIPIEVELPAGGVVMMGKKERRGWMRRRRTRTFEEWRGNREETERRETGKKKVKEKGTKCVVM